MKCTKCQSSNKIKAGFARERQRYKCKDCGYFFSVEKKSDVKTLEQKRLALEMYLEGLGFRAIGRLLNISYGTVYQWIKKWGESVELPKNEVPIEIVELDEIHSYVQHKKNYCWSWIAVDRLRKRFISFICDKRDTKTFLKLWEQLKNRNINVFCSDYWKSYSELIPSERHVASKAETFTVEGYNSRIRHYLARFKRKTKCYSKSKTMLENSLKLLCLKLNNELNIII
ncbi:IS1 family transposase [Riemerella anatipestifer]|uniref:IS1 family transposase n=1 Tax=Riemerella anatipestifer TaxID=34085 RepID=UPI001122E147|nr:IS1 family transposase [Riemerella anatipestifer]MCO7332227.1 IS1 family transposase [Riemerella anatipestifer]MCO7351116.1 IS1 family transposase [Riemerella anatipestifer]MCW0487184.1 IS1 family transposase [Riemerella anatipestifer]MCW0492844.1 IS1 family transposase [Riemerella anatipestifer]MDD1549857.1 IS1 family transposase [Riemerella anatipestifer]